MGRPLDSSRSLLGRVVHTVGRKIVGGELPPGAVMPVEAEWGAQMGVSRTVMREATKVLISKGLVESRPKTGTRVRGAEFWNRLDPDVLAWQMAVAPRETFVREIFEFRRTIEPSVAALAATRVTPEQLDGMARALDGMTEAGDDGRQFIGPDLDFHLGILNAVDNGMIRSLSGVIETALTISMYLSLDNPRGQRHSLPLHRAVYDAIRAGEPEGARSAMLRLVDDAEDDAAKAMKTRGVGGTGRNGKSRKG
ncbi:MAG: FadR family transcriptional regulator [Bauldia sp.]|nr:FadR family transcriptional regulator [Bauldia sp.]